MNATNKTTAARRSSTNATILARAVKTAVFSTQR